MNVYSLSSISAAIFCMVLGILVFLKRKWDRKCRIFGIACIITGFWTLFPFAVSRAQNEAAALLVARIIYAPAVFTGVIWLHFLIVVAKEKLTKRENRILLFNYIISVPFLLLAPNPNFIKGVVRFAPYFAIVPGPIYAVFIAVFAIIFMFALREILLNYRASSGYRKNILALILIAYAIGVFSAALHFGAAYFRKEPLPHDLLIVVYTTLFAYAILKYRLMDIRVAITRTGIFVAVYALLLGLPFAMVVRLKGWFVDTFGEAWWLFPSASVAISATVSTFVYIYLQRKAEDRLLKEQRRYHAILKQTGMEMTLIHNLQKLLNFIIETIVKNVHVSNSAIYLYDPKEECFLLKAGSNINKGQSPSISKGILAAAWLQEHREPLVYEEIGQAFADHPNPAFRDLMENMKSLNASVVIPGFLQGKLSSLFILGDKISGGAYSTEDLSIFSILANQTAIGIENALLYENMEEQVRQRTKELVDVQKQLIQAEKMATVGTLAGGVAHEINNPLTAILTNVQMLLTSDTIDDQLDRESLELIEEATKRCRTIVQKLMTYARKPLESAEISRIDLLGVLKDVIAFIEYQMEQDNIRINTSTSDNSYAVMGNHNELEQVFTNLIINARDAIKQVKNSGEINISFWQNRDWVRIEIADEGAGIPEDIRSKIFDPFFTTKEVGRGVGLGLSICQAIVEKHDGVINFKSEVNKGTAFTIQLPRAKEHSKINRGA